MLKKVAILTNGGDVAGFNAVIRAIVKTAEENDIDIYLDGVTNYANDSGVSDGFLVFRDAARLVSKEKVELLE